MARGAKISREDLLAAAEQLVLAKGAAALTIGALAAEAGVSKGGVQTMFGTKEALVLDLVQRWLDREQAEFREALTDQPNPTLAHIDQTRRLDEASHGKLAALLAVASHSPAHTGMSQAWYAERTNRFEANTAAERQERLAFLATEGAYFLRFLVGIPFDDDAWREMFEDIRTLAATARD